MPSELLRTFWETHDPTQGYRQGNDVGTPVPLGGLLDDGRAEAGRPRRRRPPTSRCSTSSTLGQITTDARPATDAGPFYYAEDYHQQYLHKVPNGYCGLGGTGISCPVGVVKSGQS